MSPLEMCQKSPFVLYMQCSIALHVEKDASVYPMSMHSERPEDTPKYTFQNQKLNSFLVRRQYPSQTRFEWGGDTPFTYRPLHILSVCGAYILSPLALHLPHPNPNLVSAVVKTLRYASMTAVATVLRISSTIRVTVD